MKIIFAALISFYWKFSYAALSDFSLGATIGYSAHAAGKERFKNQVVVALSYLF